MAWKDLFVNKDENETNNTTKKVEIKKETSSITKFPDSQSSQTQSTNFGFNQNAPVQQQSQSLGQVSSEMASKFLEAYENAFNEMNQPGYDFFEFFQALINGDINNPQSYTMAFAMGKGMDKTVSKEKLLTQSDYYINELTNLYNKNVNDGTQKKQDLVKQKETENQNLSSELSSLKQQLEGIQVQIQDRQNKLSLIDNKYQPKIAEYDSKLMANDFAKNKIISAIETVKQGIANNLK